MKKNCILWFASILIAGHALSQQLPSTLLWKISGNGLQKSSYLYGTIHLTDERVFNIGDSMYKAIENSDGFAIEIDPGEFTPFVIDEAKREIMQAQRLKNMMSDKEFKKYGKALAKRLNKNEDDITAADILKEKNKWIEESYRTGKMQTFLDAYLFDVARRQGKWTGGVEDLQDQEDLANYMFDETDMKELVSDEEDNSYKGKTKSPLEQMISLYMQNDLNGIDRFSNGDDSAYHDRVLTKRNKKMAMRMDSLSHERSMVFAVGAAHLPGSDGLIALLKERGFTITPVFASKKIKPSEYKVKEIALPWYDVKDEAGLYSTSMPGKPGDMLMYGVLNMKLYFDVFQSTIYMTSALNTPYSQTMADSIMGTISNNYFGVKDYKKGKPVSINNVPGREFSSNNEKYSRGYLLYKDGIMYMAIAMSMKKDSVAAESINKFLQSFAIHETNDKTDDRKYITYTDKARAYSIESPAKPNKANDMVAANPEISIERDLNVAIDPKSGDYLFFGVTQAAPGYFIENDSTTFVNIKESQKSKFAGLSLDTMYFKNGHRVMEFGGIMQQAPLMMKTHYEFRGNRWYALVGIYDPKKDTTVIDHFFSSFKMLDYATQQWKKYTTEDAEFSTWAPSELKKYDKTDSLESLHSFKYECFDTSRADDFIITVESFSKYYWQQNDSILLKKLAHVNINYKDTILSEKPVSNGNVKGLEIIVQHEGSANVKRKRLLLNNNKLYTLLTIQPVTEIYNDNNTMFFEDFRLSETQPNDDLYTSKAALILKDITSTDSATSATAKNYLSLATFGKEELPLLHEALLKKYTDNTATYNITKENIKDVIVGIKDSSSFVFAKNNYVNASDEDKIHLLDIMVAFPTNEHFNDIKTLLLQHPPKHEPGYSFVYGLTDSLELTAGIFPGMLPLLKDTNLASLVIRMAKPLLDSGLASNMQLQPYEKDILASAQNDYKKLKNDPENYDYANYALLKVLGKMNTATTNTVLQNYSQLKKSPYIAMNAVEQLLQNKQAINLAALQNLAASNETRTELYDSLQAYKKQALFPRTYFTQKYFAESYVYRAASDDDEPTNLTYLTQKVIDFKGKKSRFFFYKVAYGEDEYASYSLACAGPFNVNTTDVSSGNATGELYYDEDFDPANLSEQADALIKQMADWYTWDKKKNE